MNPVFKILVRTLYVAFHLGLHCFLRYKQSPGTKEQLNLTITTCHHLICTMNHPRLIVSNYMEELFNIQRVNDTKWFCFV